jgi:hypothetical protein
MITWIPYRGYGTMEQREKPPRNESFTKSAKKLMTCRESANAWLSSQFQIFFFSPVCNEGVNQEGEDTQEEHKHGLPPLSFKYSL